MVPVLTQDMTSIIVVGATLLANRVRSVALGIAFRSVLGWRTAEATVRIPEQIRSIVAYAGMNVKRAKVA
jgi:hypothetical protein